MKSTFAGANIKGTKAMKSSSVRHDLRLIKQKADIIGLQEFKWRSYWLVLISMLPGWASHPGKRRSVSRPVEGAQAVVWRRRMFKKLKVYSRPAFNFKQDNAGIMDNRWFRAVLLKRRADSFAAWFLSAHFVVGGDEGSDGPRRKAFMNQNLNALDQVLHQLKAGGYPIMAEIDANIRKDTWAYDRLREILKEHDATLYGAHGIEYAFSINNDRGSFRGVTNSIISDSKLDTDHEVRLLTWDGVVT